MSGTGSRLRKGGAGLVIVATLGGCSSDQPAMPEAAAIELSERVAQVRAAAGAGDVDSARARLGEIGTVVEDLRSGGEISEPDAARIAAATTDVDQGLGLLTTTTTPPAASAPPLTTTPASGERSTPGHTPADASDDDDEDDVGDEAEDEDTDEVGRKGPPKDDDDRGRGRD